jgi:hypothetical protein
MANTSYNLKNNTAEKKKWGGMEIAPNSTYAIQEVDIPRLLSDDSFITSILSSEATINDSLRDIAPQNVVDRLKENIALSTLFESENTLPKRNNGFQAINVQEAIEELKNNPENFINGKVFSETFSYYSTAKNRWLRIEYGLTSDECPLIIPFDCYLVAMTMVNYNYADTDIEIHNMKRDSEETNLQYLWPIRDSRSAIINIPKDEEGNYFEYGDKVGIYVVDRGSNLKEVRVKLYFIIKDKGLDHNEQFYNDLERN